MRLNVGMLALAAGLLAAAAVHAATPAEDAAEAARQWAKAVMERDVDTQHRCHRHDDACADKFLKSGKSRRKLVSPGWQLSKSVITRF